MAEEMFIAKINDKTGSQLTNSHRHKKDIILEVNSILESRKYNKLSERDKIDLFKGESTIVSGNAIVTLIKIKGKGPEATVDDSTPLVFIDGSSSKDKERAIVERLLSNQRALEVKLDNIMKELKKGKN